MTLYQSRASVTLSDNTTKEVYLTVPKGKIWKIYAIMMHNGDDVDRGAEVKIMDSNNNVLHGLSSTTITAGARREMISHEPTAPASSIPFKFPVLIKGGNKLYLKWAAGGASSGGTAYYCITYEEVPE